MASSMAGGMFRESKKLKGKGKGKGEATATPLPPPVSSEQYRGFESLEASLAANGSSKAEDHFGFLYSVSDKDFH